MSNDPRVDLIFSHFVPRYIATGVDSNDLARLRARIGHWDDWCRVWSDAGAGHAKLAHEAADRGRRVTAAEAWLRASICYHYGKHLFAVRPDEYEAAHDAMLRCYRNAALGIVPTMQHVAIPHERKHLAGWLRRPRATQAKATGRTPVAVILPGLDACKEELHVWSDAFLDRGMATLTLDGPGQGESAADFPISTDWGRVFSAVIDALGAYRDLDTERIGVVGQSLGAFYAPLAAALEPRIKACVANCGPFDFGPVLPQMPDVSQEVFRIRAHKSTLTDGLAFARTLTLADVAHQIRCPLLIIFGAGDRIIPAAEGQRLADAAKGPVDLVVYDEGNHVCFNIPYKFRPLSADWMAEKLNA